MGFRLSAKSHREDAYLIVLFYTRIYFSHECHAFTVYEYYYIIAQLIGACHYSVFQLFAVFTRQFINQLLDRLSVRIPIDFRLTGDSSVYSKKSDFQNISSVVPQRTAIGQPSIISVVWQGDNSVIIHIT